MFWKVYGTLRLFLKVYSFYPMNAYSSATVFVSSK